MHANHCGHTTAEVSDAPEHSGSNRRVFRNILWLADIEKNVTIKTITRNSVSQCVGDLITSPSDQQSTLESSDSSNNLLFNSSFNQSSSPSITQSIKRRITQTINHYQGTTQSNNHHQGTQYIIIIFLKMTQVLKNNDIQSQFTGYL